MSQFEYDIEYRSIIEHGNADALSRLSDKNELGEEEDAKEINLIAEENIEVLPVTYKEIRKKQDIVENVILHKKQVAKFYRKGRCGTAKLLQETR